MPIKVSFYAERPDTTKDFWWETAEDPVATICQNLRILADSKGIQHTFSKADDGLSSTSEFVAPTRAAWLDYMANVQISYPHMITMRDEYYKNANHTLLMTVTDLGEGSVLLQTSEAKFDPNNFEATKHVWTDPTPPSTTPDTPPA